MKIYTKTGDLGETGVLSGQRIAKSELVIEANGALDEATSFIGWAREVVEADHERDLLSDIQHDLYEVMGYLAGAPFRDDHLAKRVVVFEKMIDRVMTKLPPLTKFILPQGGETTTRLHIARTIVRSAERRVVRYVKDKAKYYTAGDKGKKNDLLMIQYLNRLSDLLFTLARQCAQVEKIA